MTNENTVRPAAIPFDSELARRAEQPRYAVDRVASTVAYHAGPEIAVTTVVGGGGALLVHPAALPVVAVLAAVHAVVDAVRLRRAGAYTSRAAAKHRADTPTSTNAPAPGVDADDTADTARTEGIA